MTHATTKPHLQLKRAEAALALTLCHKDRAKSHQCQCRRKHICLSLCNSFQQSCLPESGLVEGTRPAGKLRKGPFEHDRQSSAAETVEHVTMPTLDFFALQGTQEPRNQGS